MINKIIAHIPITIGCLLLLNILTIPAFGQLRINYFKYHPFNVNTDGAREYFQWETGGAKELIECLIELKKNNKPALMTYYYHFNWVTKDDIPYLINILDSTEPCASVVFPYTSKALPSATVSQEAKKMIFAFWQGFYPAQVPDTWEDVPVEHIRSWYKLWSSGNQNKWGGQKRG
ncbi:hypothetical protein OH491_05130 [Termitidicoccus mucosus]|uniref:hypothetical protein n=1 Tax=Termitidicoccus mucosus TaxID=1184151 RepID=UPI00318381E1